MQDLYEHIEACIHQSCHSTGLFFLLIAGGIESNPGPGSESEYRDAQFPRGRGRGGRGGRGRGRDTTDVFANASDTGVPSQNSAHDQRYSLRRRPTNQPSVSDWLIDSQQVQSSAHGPTQQNLTGTKSDMDLASENSETDDNILELTQPRCFWRFDAT